MNFCSRFLLFALFSANLLTPALVNAQAAGELDLADVNPGDGIYRRVLGSAGSGQYGVPVAGGADLDKDGFADYAMAAMVASPQSRPAAGLVFLVFGDGKAVGTVDTALNPSNVLEIHGDQTRENIGSEIWMSDLTGDGFGDLVICRQNYSPDDQRTGAGAMTLIPADPALRTMAANNQPLDLRSPPEGIRVFTIYGASAYDRLCIWARNGDVTGDGVDELAIGADGEYSTGDQHAGAAYILRGGSWLDDAADIDLADFGSVAEGKLARVKPALVNGDIDASHYHFGATLTLADLDGNGRAELISAAALNRAGASLIPPGSTSADQHGSGGTDNGTLYIAWDDNFAGNWIPAPDFVVGSGTGSHTIIDGGHNGGVEDGAFNDDFGEEILGGEDYNGDGEADLFTGDLTADGYGIINRNNAGVAQVIYSVADYKNMSIELDSPPVGFQMATFLGPTAGGIAGDTAMHGDFNGDGIADIAFSAPHDDPEGRAVAGTLYIVLGQDGYWPVFSNLLPAFYPDIEDVQIHEVWGAEGSGGGSVGDTLCYSGNAADITGDGVIDLIINEMQGDGSSVNDVGNLLVLDSRVLFKGQEVHKDSFESQD